jgi:hypothetical protein
LPLVFILPALLCFELDRRQCPVLLPLEKKSSMIPSKHEIRADICALPHK